MTDSKRIAKNTLYLYFRMFIIMGVSLFTSRIVLDKLGATDFGIINIVGGVVGMLGFLNSTLSTSTSRFLTFALGRSDKKKLASTFTTAFYNHAILAIAIIVIMETIGVWFLYHKLQISPDRMHAAFVVFQISLLTTFVSITQVPYSASIIAHENMNVYAYISIVESIIKLIIVYFLVITPFDKLITYFSLLAVSQIVIALYYRYYCSSHYEECHIVRQYDKSLLKDMAQFSGWDILANIVELFKTQGIIVIMGMFFQPAIVAAQAIGNQIAGVMMQFVSNVRMAINPQIIKSYAAGNFLDSKKLTLASAVYVYDLLLLLGLPILVLLPTILNVWLIEVPPYTLEFARFIIIQRIIANFDYAFYLPMMASGKLKSNSLAAVYVGFTQVLILYILLKCGFSVMWVQYMGLIMICIYSLYIKPFILYKEHGYTIKELLTCYLKSAEVTLVSLILVLSISYFIDTTTVIGFIVILVISILAVLCSSYIFMDKIDRKQLFYFVISKLKGRFNH